MAIFLASTRRRSVFQYPVIKPAISVRSFFQTHLFHDEEGVRKKISIGANLEAFFCDNRTYRHGLGPVLRIGIEPGLVDKRHHVTPAVNTGVRRKFSRGLEFRVFQSILIAAALILFDQTRSLFFIQRNKFFLG